MNRYIDADKLLKSTISKYRCVPLVGIPSYRNGEEYFDGEDFDDLINNTPTADVTEVRHGEWKTTVLINTPEVFKTGAPHCSECKRTAPHRTKFCPECGAKMDGKRRTNND